MVRGGVAGRVVGTVVLLGLWVCAASPGRGAEDAAAPLPPGVRAVWDLAKAHREATTTRERVCINGLWRFRPARSADEPLPDGGWGHIKVPGPWPRGDRSDNQRLYPHPSWADRRLSEVNQAWHQRTIGIPQDWAGRRIAVSTAYLNSFAAVYVDGRRLGEIRFPWGEVDITSACRPGASHVLTLFVAAVPLKDVVTVFSQTNQSSEVKGTVDGRGLCGDVFLTATPAGARITDVKVDTSVRDGTVSLDVALEGLEAGREYGLRAVFKQDGETVREVEGPAFGADALAGGRFRFGAPWRPDRLWDTHTPQNVCIAEVSLVDGAGGVLDAFLPVRFGFRELRVDGRDLRLNGSRIQCFVLPLESHRAGKTGVAGATYEGACETFRRLKDVGVNLVYTHNYNCHPGVHVGLEEIFRAADDVGMLMALFLPHAMDFPWDAPDAEETNGFAEQAEFYVRMAQNHPSVVMYAMNANTMGYADSVNPHHMDGLHDRMGEKGPRDDERALIGLRSEAVVQRFDTTRPIYHHSAGTLGQMHTLNHYINFVPIQERSDWFEHWANAGVMPLILTEYGAPCELSWTMHRGYPNGKMEGRWVYGNDSLLWQFCTAEWGAQFRGDAAFDLTETERRNLRYEAGRWRENRPFKRWDYPSPITASPLGIPNVADVGAAYITDNWRAYRTWGVTAFNIWTHNNLFKLRDGVDRRAVEFPTDWDALQRPGFSPDLVDRRQESFEMAYAREDWQPAATGEAFLRNNRPLLAYIAGRPGEFTGKDHNVLPGETVRKQIIVINNSRRTVTADCSWTLAAPTPVSGAAQATVETGEQARIPLEIALPDALPAGEYALTMRTRFDTGEVQDDAFAVHVLAPAPALECRGRVALFDPKGETAALLRSLGIEATAIDAGADLAGFDLLVIGRHALTADGPAPDLAPVRGGLRAIVFEQTRDVLERRLGFRVQEYGLRRVFPRVPDHPVLAGLATANLRDWRGQATSVPPVLEYEFVRWQYPLTKWCGLDVTRGWRSSRRGSVASVLIEKPACGDFLPIVDGAFGLQYSPLLEWREGNGLVVFCQMDVTGRTEDDPAAGRLVRNLLAYADGWRPDAPRGLLYAGDQAGRAHLKAAGLSPADYEGGRPAADRVLAIGPGAAGPLAPHRAEIAAWLGEGGRVLAVGLTEAEANAVLPGRVAMRQAEHINAVLPAAPLGSPLAGVGPADVHNRDPRELSLVTAGATPVGNGVLGLAPGVVFCQLVPWQFDYEEQFNRKMTYRRASYLVNRVLANMGVRGRTPLPERFAEPVRSDETRWLDALYMDTPVELDDPYRFFVW